jgi:DNA-binding GntR family transcriptional regulator
MARQAALAAIAETLQPRLPALWQPNAEDLRHSLSALKSPDAFADLAQRFHSRFVDRLIHYYIDRNLHHMIWPDQATKSLSDIETFNGAIRRHCDEASLIMRAFARDWPGKNFYKDGKVLTRDDVRHFASHSAEKIRIELAQRKGSS